jgi:streptothricin acetyltransferase
MADNLQVDRPGMISVEELTASNLGDAGRCDGAFEVSARLVISAGAGKLAYTVAAVPPYEKRYPAEAVDYAGYIGQPDRVVYLAYVDGRTAGEMRLCRWWNRFGYVEDIVVDRPFRRRGVGGALIGRAKQWAQRTGLPGMMLETQDNNVAACRLYARCGFELAGFDRRLYQGLHPGTDEIALYWYWIVEDAA